MEVFFFLVRQSTLQERNVVEYSFKTSSQADLTTIKLGDYSLSIRKNGVDETVSYANILIVRINKYADGSFRITMDIDGYGEIVVPNWTYSQNNMRENQSGAYSLFVRVLHHHLKDKSTAEYKAGNRLAHLWQWALISALLSFIISITADYLGFGLMNPYFQSLILSALVVAIIFVFTVNKLPKTYNPSNIPLQFLP